MKPLLPSPPGISTKYEARSRFPLMCTGAALRFPSWKAYKGVTVGQRETLMVVTSGSYVSIRTADGDNWLSLAGVGLPVTAGSAKFATVFFVERLAGDGPIRSGDEIRIRGVDKDPWLVPTSSGVAGVPGPAPSGATLRIDAIGNTVPEISLYTRFRLNGLEGDPFFRFSAENLPLITSSHDDATQFVFDNAERPKEVAQAAELNVEETSDGLIRLGWMTYPLPCSRLELPAVTLRLVEQRTYLYAEVDQELIKDAKQDCLECLGVAAAAATLAALFASPGATPGVFTESFTKCLDAKGVSSTLYQAVHLSVKNECQW